MKAFYMLILSVQKVKHYCFDRYFPLIERRAQHAIVLVVSS